MGWWNAILLWIGSLFGKSEGASEQRSTDQEKQSETEHAILKAEERAPNTNDALINELLDPTKRV